MVGNYNSGRKAQPASLRRLKGNPGHRKIPDARVEVFSPPAIISEVPEFLRHPRELALYHRIINDYQQRRIARPADIYAYARWATYVHRWMATKELTDMLAEKNVRTRIGPPDSSEMIKLENVISQLESKLGLTPIARHQIVRGLAAMPADFGGAPHEHTGTKPDAPARVSPIGFGRVQ